MAAYRRIPILLCGRQEAIGTVVINALKPEYEVIHFITSPEEGVANIPRILSGFKPTSQRSTLGSQDFSRPPRAVLLGAGYDDTMIANMRRAVMETQGTRKVPWLKADQQKTEAGPVPGSKNYAESIGPRAKESLGKLENEGKLDGNEDGIFTW